MIKRSDLISLIAIVFVGFLIAASPDKKDVCTIEGNIVGGEGTTVYLYKEPGMLGFQAKELVDSAVIVNGKFKFRTNLSSQGIMTVRFTPDENRGARRSRINPFIPVFVDNSTIAIHAIFDSIPTTDAFGTYDYSKVSVTGSSALNKIFGKYMYQRYSALKKVNDKWLENAMYIYTRENKPISKGIVMAEEMKKEKQAFKSYLLDLITANKDNPLGLFIFSDNLAILGTDVFTLDDINRIEATLSPEIKESPRGKTVMQKADRVKISAVGAKYTDFEFFTRDSSKIRLSDYLGQGKYVLLEFWASWCGPCRITIPHLKEAYKWYNPSGFEVLSVSMDEDWENWFKALDEEQMPWPQALYPQAFDGELTKTFNFRGIPACLLISPDGIITDREMRNSWMDKILLDLYGNKFGNDY